MPIDKDSITGTTTLLEVKKVAGVEVMEIETKIHADGEKRALGNGMTLRKASVDITIDNELPTDVSKAELSTKSSIKLSMRLTGTDPAGNSVDTTVKVRETSEETHKAAGK